MSQEDSVDGRGEGVEVAQVLGITGAGVEIGVRPAPLECVDGR